MRSQGAIGVIAVCLLLPGFPCARVLAQEGTPPEQEAAPPEQDVAQEDASEPERGVRIGDYVATGEVEIGWRFTGLDGSRELYRSQVDLPDGPTLAFSRVELRSPENTGPIFDALTVEGSGWGSEPNTHARARAERRGLYVADYWNRRVDSYNFAPDF